MDKKYRINEVFKTIQGEGVRSGTVNVFVRFSGCNLTCRMEPGEKSIGGFDCDTEFASGDWYTLDQLVNWIKKEAGDCRWVVFTGGEPALQLDLDLVVALHDSKFWLAIETNGSIDVSGLELDWICVSPKVAEHAVRQLTANEVKYVRNYGQAIPKPACKSDNQLISPGYDGNNANQRNIEWCTKLVMDNPTWRLSVQYHKLWKVR
jgi:hypothetical protein